MQPNLTCEHILTDEQTILYLNLCWYLEGIGSIFVGGGGMVLNLIAICVIIKSDLADSFFYWLLICLEIFDSCFLLCGILVSIGNYISSTSVYNYIFVVFLYPFRNVVMLCSIYITVALSVERYRCAFR